MVLVDVIPHLLHHLLLNTIPRHRERAQLAYKVALGIIGAYTEHSAEMGLPNEYLYSSIRSFIRGVLCEAQITEPSHQFVYAILTLLNTLLAEPGTNFVTTKESGSTVPRVPPTIFSQAVPLKVSAEETKKPDEPN